jgi:hypothetical protein
MSQVGCSSKHTQDEHVDHIILAISDLDKGVLQFKNATGIKPVFGGVHPNSFSQNALVALDHNMYIEIMAPKKEAKNIPKFFSSLDSLTIIGWAVRTFDIDATRERLKSIGLVTSENKEGSRAKPDGALLTWTTFSLEENGVLPFFIQWGNFSNHPSVSSPGGCRLKSFFITSENPEPLDQINNLLHLKIDVTKGKPGLSLSIETPKGTVSFSGK